MGGFRGESVGAFIFTSEISDARRRVRRNAVRWKTEHCHSFLSSRDTYTSYVLYIRSFLLIFLGIYLNTLKLKWARPCTKVLS
jgi:hypothetical protein